MNLRAATARAAVFLAAVGAITPLQAAPVTFDSRTAFEAGAPGTQVIETFEGFTTGNKTSPLTLSNSQYTATTPSISRGATLCGAAANMCLNDSNVANARTFSAFTPGTSGFGVDLKTGFGTDTLRISVVSGSGTYTFARTINTTTSFFGFSDTTDLQQVAFTVTSGAATYTFDNATVSVTPEPAAWSLLILGFGAVGGTLRRRKARLPRAIVKTAI